MANPITNVVGFDDAPFSHQHRGDVRIFGAVCARTRLDGVVSGLVRRDGSNSARRMAELVEQSQFKTCVRAVLLQGIAVAGFNVVDVQWLSERLALPVVVVARRKPRLALIHEAVFRTRGAERKWQLIQRAGEMEPCDSLWIQRVGIDHDAARALLRATTLHGNLPEPLRLAHLIAGGVTAGTSRGRA
ncbi:MAG TPA: DUF99 family protein [Polyangiaceae bacterium]|nr:DUF99 family protein [Polyangiaceae bacterium]